jgi:Fe2+ transport system protein FeoA
MIAPLSCCAPGCGPLAVIDVGGDDPISGRLHELGITIGSVLELHRPGNPAVIGISGGRLALGHELQQRILVRVPV